MGKAKVSIAKDGQRIERSIYARVSPVTGHITALQVKLTAPGSKAPICESFERLDEARSFRDSVLADLALDPYRERVLRAREEGRRKRAMMGITLADALQTYEEKVTPTKKSAASERYVLAKLRRYPISRKPLIGLRPENIRELGRALRAEGMKPVTVSKHLSKLSAVLTWARGAYDYPVPNAVLELPASERRTAGKSRDRRLTLNEEKFLRVELEKSPDPAMLPMFDLALETAARFGELLSLLRSDVDLKARVAWLRDTKNGHDRPLLLSSRAVAALEQLLALPVRRLDRRVIHLVKPTHAKYWQAANKRALAAYRTECEDSGVDPDAEFLVGLRWHDLRHEAISRIAERGALASVQQMQMFSGHKDLRMLQRYTHIRTFTDLAQRLG